jgi:hypothetical protein
MTNLPLGYVPAEQIGGPTVPHKIPHHDLILTQRPYRWARV